MYYSINVSIMGRHFFATSEHSLTNESKLKEVYKAMLKAFPVSKGYEISITRWEKCGYDVKPADIAKM